MEASLKDQECFVEIRAYYLAQTSDNLAVGREFGVLEEKSSTFLWHLAQCGGCGQQIVDAVVVNFVHADNDCILGGLVNVDIDVIDRRGLGQGGHSGHVFAG